MIKNKNAMTQVKALFLIVNIVVAVVAFSWMVGSVDGAFDLDPKEYAIDLDFHSTNEFQDMDFNLFSSGKDIPSSSMDAVDGAAASKNVVPNALGWMNSGLIKSLGYVAAFTFAGYVVGGFLGGNGGYAGAHALGGGALVYQALSHPERFGGLGDMGKGLLGRVGGSPMFWGVATGAVIFVLMYRKSETEIVEFNCEPWQPPIGGSDCEVCNDYGECSEYRCKSLGQACGLIPENVGTEEEACVWLNPHDTNSPIIKVTEVSKGYIWKPDTSVRPPATGIVISQENGDCIEAFFPLEFTFTTKDEETGLGEPAQCKIDYNLTRDYDSMNYYVGGTNLFTYNHTEQMSLPGPDTINAIAPELKNDGTYTLYTRCKDANDNVNEAPFSVRFCVEKGPDTTPPRIDSVDIPSGSPISSNISNLDIEVYVNEPAECKWSTQDRSFDNMEESMQCSASLWEMNENNLYTCETTLTGIEDRKENDFYFKCRDVSEKQNVNTQSYKYTVIGTQPLNILEVGPNETIKGSTETISFDLTISTDNGFDNGRAFCSYYNDDGNNKPESDEDYILFAETDSNKHSQEQRLLSGSYTYYYKCVDLGANAAYDSTSFTIDVDKSEPSVVRVYKEGDLKVITNEPSICSYSTSNCNFEIDDGIAMPYNNEEVHTAEWKINQKYYIRCKDKYDNQANPNTCSVIVNPYALGENVIEL